jgi:hypothetical protein
MYNDHHRGQAEMISSQYQQRSSSLSLSHACINVEHQLIGFLFSPSKIKLAIATPPEEVGKAKMPTR